MTGKWSEFTLDTQVGITDLVATIDVNPALAGTINANKRTQINTILADKMPKEHAILPVSPDDTSDITTALTWRGTVPYDFILTGVKAVVADAPTGSDLNFNIEIDGQDLFASEVAIADGSDTVVTTAYTYDFLRENSTILVTVSQVGSTNNGKGLKVYLIGYSSIAAFNPNQLSDVALFLHNDPRTMFQSNAGTTAVTTAADVVGFWQDLSGNDNHFSSKADDTTRPAFNETGYPSVLADGSNDALVSGAGLNAYESGAYGCMIACESDTLTNGARLFCEGGTSGRNNMFRYDLSQCRYQVITAGAGEVAQGSPITDGFDDTPNVLIRMDRGGIVSGYNDGVESGVGFTYTPAGTTDLDDAILFAEDPVTPEDWWSGKVSSLVLVVGRVFTDAEVALLTTWGAATQGRSI